MSTCYGAVVIGRNEGPRLTQCLRSLNSASVVVYVDSGSTDDSLCAARSTGAEVIQLNIDVPFSAARARNVGFQIIRNHRPDLEFVQFIDGDCVLHDQWPQAALQFLTSHPTAGAVFGRRRERFPERSIYNWLIDQEWDGEPGDSPTCGGDVMMRVCALESVHGYRDELIAGEEPELCLRLRAIGWHIWRLKDEMTLHDANILHFKQWWKRGIRGGYAYANVAYLHGKEGFWLWECRRAWLFGMGLPLLCAIFSALFPQWGWTLWLVYLGHLLQKVLRSKGLLSHRVKRSFFFVLIHVPQSLGQAKFLYNRGLKRQSKIIEYK